MYTRDMENTTLKCLICQKELAGEEFFAGGDILISFGYGSRHDQLGVKSVEAVNDMERMLQCDEIRAVICDDCFEAVYPMCQGFNVTVEEIEERVV